MNQFSFTFKWQDGSFLEVAGTPRNLFQFRRIASEMLYHPRRITSKLGESRSGAQTLSNLKLPGLQNKLLKFTADRNRLLFIVQNCMVCQHPVRIILLPPGVGTRCELFLPKNCVTGSDHLVVYIIYLNDWLRYMSCEARLRTHFAEIARQWMMRCVQSRVSIIVPLDFWSVVSETLK